MVITDIGIIEGIDTQVKHSVIGVFILKNHLIHRTFIKERLILLLANKMRIV